MDAGTQAERLTIAVGGRGDEAERWLRALRGVDDVAAERLDLHNADDLLQTLARADIDALALSGNTLDLPGALKRALMANRHVLVFGASAVASKTLIALDALARRRGRVLLFAADTFEDERVEFVHKMTGGAHPLWRPRYLRSLRTGASRGAALDALMIADIACAAALLGGSPARVAAIAPRIDDESGGADVAMVTLMFDGGPVAQIDVSLIEPQPRHEVTLACEGRTMTFDVGDSGSPLRIQAFGRGRIARGVSSQGAWSETVTEPPADGRDRIERATSMFVSAVRARDSAASNARQMADAACVWERARESMAQGGAPVEIDPVAEATRPKLKLIVGGGHVDVSHPAPDLTIVNGGHHAPSPTPEPDPEPLRSA